MSPQFQNPFDITGADTLPVIEETRTTDNLEVWWDRLRQEGMEKKAVASRKSDLTTDEIEKLARTAFEKISAQAL